MRVRLLVVVSVLGLIAACGADSDSSSATPGTSPVADSRPTTTTASPTAATPAPADVPRYLRFDASGLYVNEGEGEQQVTSEAIWSVSHDGMGGVLYATRDEAAAPGVHWTRTGSAEPETLNYLRGWGAVLDGRPVLVAWPGLWSENCPETTEPVHLVDLLTLRTGFSGASEAKTAASPSRRAVVACSWESPGWR